MIFITTSLNKFIKRETETTGMWEMHYTNTNLGSHIYLSLGTNTNYVLRA